MFIKFHACHLFILIHRYLALFSFSFFDRMPMLYHFAKGFLMNLIKFFQKKDNTPKKLGYTNTHNIESPSEHTTTKKEKRYKNLGIQILICVLFIVIIGLLVYIMLSRYEANYKETENTETSEDTHHEYKQQCIIKQQDSIDSNYSSYDGFNAMFSESLVYSLVDHESFNDLRLPPISSYEQIQQIEKETKQKETSIGYEIFYELFGENLNRSFNSTLKDSYFSKKYFNELHSNTLTFDDDKENIREARQCNGKECQIKGYDTKGNLLYNEAMLAQSKLGAVIGIRLNCKYEGLRFLPFSPALESGTALAWKKEQFFSAAASSFIEFSIQYLKDITHNEL